MASVSTNKVQKVMLIKFMEKNPDISMGITNIKHSKERWEKFAVALNSRGPPMKTWEQWNRVWINFKAKQKKKLCEKRAELMATGVELNIFNALTPLESSMENLLQLNESVDPLKQEYELIVPEAPYEPEVIDIKMEVPSEDENYNNECAAPTNQKMPALKRTSKLKVAEGNKRMELLRQQVDNQNKYHKEILARFDSLNNSLKRLVALKEEELKILREKS